MDLVFFFLYFQKFMIGQGNEQRRCDGGFCVTCEWGVGSCGGVGCELLWCKRSVKEMAA